MGAFFLQSVRTYVQSVSSKNPQFSFWYKTLQLEITILAFVRSQRTGDFDLYVSTLKEIIPWLFALDHTNYTRWLPVHLADMVRLESTAPELAEEFKQGRFVVQKSSNPFSSVSFDQAHENHNKEVKGDGGIIGLT